MAAAVPDETQPGSSLATLFIDDEAIERVNEGVYSAVMAPAWDDGNLEGLEFAAPWPRFMYGQLVRELKAQGAKAVGFDIFFSEYSIRSPTTDVTLDKTNVFSSDEFFAHEIAEAGNVVLSTEGGLLPRPMFAEGAVAIANIASTNDYAVLRRVRAFGEYKVWHPQIESLVKALDLRLKEAHLSKTNQFILEIPRIAKGTSFLDGEKPEPLRIPLHRNGNLKLTKDGNLNLNDDRDDMSLDTSQPPYTFKKAWNLGVAMAALKLGLDLDKAIIEPTRITLAGTNGVTRVIPTDKTHAFYIDWKLRWEDIKNNRTGVIHGSPTQLLVYDYGREMKHEHDWRNMFTNRLVIVGSVATGNNLTDLGATPLEGRTPLVTKHLNVANSILEGRFVHRTSIAGTLLFIIIAGALAGWITWRSKVVHASIGIGVIAAIYIVAAFAIYVQTRNWIPIIMPVFGGLLFPHFCLVTYRVAFEQKQQRHLKSVFQRVVAPEVVSELLAQPNITLGGERRDISVYFADVRGFTEFTDSAHAAAEEYVKRNNLSVAAAEAFYDRQAKETMSTVNLYLGIISDQIKKHRGTLDKYIGDCVMAFWGAPLGEEKHALCAVRAAIDAQRAMYAANQFRAKENERIKAENVTRAANGQEPLTLLPLLTLGSGINTGICIVGMMGSEKHVTSYTVFGREVNLASRLEGVSGRGRIIVSQITYEDVKKFDAELAATFVELEPVKVKGIREAVRIYEVPWKETETAPAAVAPVSEAAAAKA